MSVIIYTLVMCHITTVFYAIYIHRGLTHSTIQYHPVFEHFIRFWIWLTDGVNIPVWAIVHRKHHEYTDDIGDPHSPVVEGFWRAGIVYFFYTMIRRYNNPIEPWEQARWGYNLRYDWMERNLYQPYQRCGLFLLLAINIMLFSWWGIAAWLIQISCTPFWSNTLINGGAHLIGYQHAGTKEKDNSRNLFPIGILMAGDELHNNHHREPWNPNQRHRWYEFDLGFIYITIFRKLGWLKLTNYKQ